MHGGQVIDVDAPMGRLAALEVDAEASAAKAAGFLREGLGDRLRNLGDTAAGLADLADAFETAAARAGNLGLRETPGISASRPRLVSTEYLRCNRGVAATRPRRRRHRSR